MLLFPVDKSKVQAFIKDLNQVIEVKASDKLKKYNLIKVDKMEGGDSLNMRNSPSGLK
jgi:hypothetical protein